LDSRHNILPVLGISTHGEEEEEDRAREGGERCRHLEEDPFPRVYNNIIANMESQHSKQTMFIELLILLHFEFLI